ncbi:MAG: hypothetical protein ACO2PN_13860 [Pyrobaculum sp.]|jgi:hypothetical protein
MYAELARPYVKEVKRNRWMGRALGRFGSILVRLLRRKLRGIGSWLDPT